MRVGLVGAGRIGVLHAGTAYATELADFVAHALGRIPNPCPPEDALEALYVAEAAALSLAERRPVQVDEVR